MIFHRRLPALAAILALGTAAVTCGARAEPGGCMKYGAAGAVGGHMVGKGHAVAGGAAGCATGMVRRHEARKKAAAAQGAATQGAQGQATKDSDQSMGANKPQP